MNLGVTNYHWLFNCVLWKGQGCNRYRPQRPQRRDERVALFKLLPGIFEPMDFSTTFILYCVSPHWVCLVEERLHQLFSSYDLGT